MKKPPCGGFDLGNSPFEDWSGREDLNLRPPAPHAGTLPGCATPRRDRSIADALLRPSAERVEDVLDLLAQRGVVHPALALRRLLPARRRSVAAALIEAV